MLKHLRLTIALSIAALLFAPIFAIAQETTGSISGTLTDASGATIKGATITLVNSDRGATERTLKTNSAGFYTAQSMPLGTYTVKITAPSFKSEAVTGLVLHANDALTVNRALTSGNEGETITITADQVQLNLQDATSSSLINATQINELVLGTRNYEQLLTLQPGVAFGGAGDQLYVGPTNPSGGSNQINFSVNGGRNTSNNWTIDGADNVDRGATSPSSPSPASIPSPSSRLFAASTAPSSAAAPPVRSTSLPSPARTPSTAAPTSSSATTTSTPTASSTT